MTLLVVCPTLGIWFHMTQPDMSHGPINDRYMSVIPCIDCADYLIYRDEQRRCYEGLYCLGRGDEDKIWLGRMNEIRSADATMVLMVC